MPFCGLARRPPLVVIGVKRTTVRRVKIDVHDPRRTRIASVISTLADLVSFRKLRPIGCRREHFDKRLDRAGDFFFGNMPRGAVVRGKIIAGIRARPAKDFK